MQLAILTKTFARPTVAGVLDAVVSHGLRCVQFNFVSAGLSPMPDRIEPGLIEQIRLELDARQIAAAAVSGTFNMIHPDPQERRDGLRRLAVLAAACPPLSIPVITLCTGTRDPDNMWRRHPGNDLPDAWTDLTQTLGEALAIAEQFSVTLGVEPEVSNVIDSAQKARRLLDEMQSPHLKIVMDGANLFPAGRLPRMREILDEGFDLLGADIVLAHAKDLDRDGEAGDRPAGQGRLDYDHYLSLLHQSNFTGALVLHSLAESDVAGCVEFLRSKLER